jgi:hypothetical protein
MGAMQETSDGDFINQVPVNLEEPTQEVEESPSIYDFTDTEGGSPVAETVERVEFSSQKAILKPVGRTSDSREELVSITESEQHIVSEPVDEVDNDNTVVGAAALVIPAAIAAGSIGIMATATQHKSGDPESRHLENATAADDAIPLIRVTSPKPRTLEVHGPFVEPLKHHVQPEEISPPTPTLPHSQTLASPVVPTPPEPTRLPPTTPRPATSYSWLGALFQPISSEVVEAQRTGWVAIQTEIVNDPPVRRSSSKLKKKARDVMVEQVSPRDSKYSHRQGSKIVGRMRSYVKGILARRDKKSRGKG